MKRQRPTFLWLCEGHLAEPVAAYSVRYVSSTICVTPPYDQIQDAPADDVVAPSPPSEDQEMADASDEAEPPNKPRTKSKTPKKTPKAVDEVFSLVLPA